jgi:peroxiredoxin
LADYRDHYEQIRAAGAEVAAISVDTPAKSAALREQLSLPFPILCDTGRRVIQEWDLLNARERGGIAKPSAFVIGPDLLVRYAEVDSVTNRAPAAEILSVLKSAGGTGQPRRKVYLPRPGDWLRALLNTFRRK